MAINFLNNVNFNKNSVEQLRVVNYANDGAAGTGVTGQLYYNSTSNILKVYTGSDWNEVGGGVTTVTTTDGTFINLTPNSATSGAVTVTADLSASGTASATSFLAGNNAWAIPAGTYDWVIKGDAASTTTVEPAQTVAILGGSNITATLSTRTVTIDYTGGTGTMSSWRIAADSGTTQNVDDGEVVSIDGGVEDLIELAVNRGKKQNKKIKLGICGEHGGDPKSIFFCSKAGLNYVSCSPYRVPIARLAAAQAELQKK